jgi:hypothetical protein
LVSCVPAVQLVHDAPHASFAVSLVHAPETQHVPVPQVPSPAAPQAFVHDPAAHVGVDPPHGAQVPPLAPHAPLAVPAAQVPALQQPPLQVCPPPHELEQAFVDGLHDESAGQSVAPLQPHFWPLMQAWGLVGAVQSLHAPPAAPHALRAVPATHAPVAEQHPPLHPLVPLPHAVEHACVVVLHACPGGQSVGPLHPQIPLARHA